MEFGFLIKKIVTLIALVDPFLAAPLFMSATRSLARESQVQFARVLGVTVAVGLLVGGLVGMHVLQLMGVTLAAMQVAGGVIALIVALAMVLAKEEGVKANVPEQQQPSKASAKLSIVPIGIPLLVGPAALAYVMATSNISKPTDLVHVVVPPILIGLLTWVVLGTAARTQKLFSPGAISVLERVGGFLLAAIAVEMMGTGLRGMFPALTNITG